MSTPGSISSRIQSIAAGRLWCQLSLMHTTTLSLQSGRTPSCGSRRWNPGSGSPAASSSACRPNLRFLLFSEVRSLPAQATNEISEVKFLLRRESREAFADFSPQARFFCPSGIRRQKKREHTHRWILVERCKMSFVGCFGVDWPGKRRLTEASSN